MSDLAKELFDGIIAINKVQEAQFNPNLIKAHATEYNKLYEKIAKLEAANKRLRELVVEAYFADPEQIRERTIECVQKAIAALKENS